MNNPQEIIIYRSPFEKAQWDVYNAISGETIIGIIAWLIAFFLIARSVGDTKFMQKHSTIGLFLCGIVSIFASIATIKVVMFALRFV